MHVLHPRILGLSGLLISGLAAGDAFTWEVAPVNTNWSGSANWAGTFGQVPNDASDSATVSGVNITDPILNNDYTIGSLSILADGDVYTGSNVASSAADNFQLTVAGPILIDGLGSNLGVRESGALLDVNAESLTLSDGGRMTLQAGSEVQVAGAISVDADSTVRGNGTIYLASPGGEDFFNDGNIRAENGTLSIEPRLGSTGIFDWDGGGGTARLYVGTDATMAIGVSQNGDAFDGVIEVRDGGTFDNDFAWSTGISASDEVILDGGADPATDAAVIAGEQATIRGTLTVRPGVGIFTADAVIDGAGVSVAGGVGVGAGRLVFQNDAIFENTTFTETAAGGRVEPNNGFEVVGGVTSVDVSIFDMDGGAGGPDVSYVQTGATLDLNVDQIDVADNRYTGTLNILGTLNVDVTANTWVNDAGTLFLRNGRLQGDRVLNEGLIHGYGLVTAAVRNEDRIAAEGGTLVMTNVDLDGATEAGDVDALMGTADLTGDFAEYGGRMRIGNGAFPGEVILRDTTLANAIIFDDNDFGEVSELRLNGGRLTVPFNAAGVYDVEFESVMDSRGQSEIRAGAVLFDVTSQTNIEDLLRMTADTAVRSSATFSGDGWMTISGGHVLNFADNASLDTVSLNVEGSMRLFGSAAGGEATVENFRQVPGGSSEFDINGFDGGVNADRLIVNGDANLRGELDLNLSFDPTLYDTYLMIPVAGSISTAATHFQTVDGVIYTRSRGLAVTYDDDGVHVTAAWLGDSNLDGAVDLLDLDTLGTNWLDGNETWTDGDFNGDGLINLIDLDLLGGNWGVGAAMGGMSFSAALAASGISVPEPGSLVLMTVGATMIGRRRRA